MKEIDHFLEQLKLEQDSKYYQPCTNVDILIRALSNLSNSYTKLGDTAKVEEIKRMMSVLESPAD